MVVVVALLGVCGGAMVVVIGDWVVFFSFFFFSYFVDGCYLARLCVVVGVVIGLLGR